VDVLRWWADLCILTRLLGVGWRVISLLDTGGQQKSDVFFSLSYTIDDKICQKIIPDYSPTDH
jgi:hypothetical protein